MDRSAGALEHLDGPLADRATLAANLRDLRRVNRFLGGTALSRRAIKALLSAAPSVADYADLQNVPLRLLDIGTGAADIPVALLAAWPRADRALAVTAIDSRPEVIEVATSTGAARTPGLQLAVADGRDLPFETGSFDIAHASLLLHHLEPADAVALLGEMRRVARLGVVVNDLARGRLAWVGAWLLSHLATGNAFTRHDAPLSVRRAYTAAEAKALLDEAGLRPIAEIHGFLRHRWALAALSA